MRKLLAASQTGFEGLLWLRDDADVQSTFSDMLDNGHYGEATLIAIRVAARKLPRMDYRRFLDKVIMPGFEVVGMGAEAVVVRSGDQVHKYLTGRTQTAEKLEPTIRHRQTLVKRYLGDCALPTEVDLARAKLFRFMPPTQYVRLTQPFVTVTQRDPHRQPGLSRKEGVSQQIQGLSQAMAELFVSEGLIMDVAQTGNIVWGHTCDDSKDRVLMIDTIPVHLGEPHHFGVKVPFWEPTMHLDYLADFVRTSDPAYFGPAELSDEALLEY